MDFLIANDQADDQYNADILYRKYYLVTAKYFEKSAKIKITLILNYYRIQFTFCLIRVMGGKLLHLNMSGLCVDPAAYSLPLLTSYQHNA